MELRTYGKILWRRMWIIAFVVGVVAIYVGYQYYTVQKSSSGSNTTYHTSVEIRIGLQAPPHSNSPTFTDYVTTSEALADEFVTGPTLTSTTFGAQITQQIQNDMATILAHYPNGDLGDWKNASAITNALTATRTHSVVIIGVSWPTEAGTWAIAQAVEEVTPTHISEYLNYQVVDSKSTNNTDYPIAAAKVISPAGNISTVTSTSTTKTSLLLALLVVGLTLGIALAFLVEYLDDRIHESSEVIQMLQLPIYGEIPRAPTPGHSQAHPPATS